jgi:hypothetical protein
MKAINGFNKVVKRMMNKHLITVMSLAGIIAASNHNKCIWFLGEGNMSDDVNEDSIRQLRLYMKEVKKMR